MEWCGRNEVGSHLPDQLRVRFGPEVAVRGGLDGVEVLDGVFDQVCGAVVRVLNLKCGRSEGEEG